MGGVKKTLSKVGNSSALILDRTLLELTGIAPQGAVDVQVVDGALVVRALGDAERDAELRRAATAAMDRFEDTFRKLAE